MPNEHESSETIDSPLKKYDADVTSEFHEDAFSSSLPKVIGRHRVIKLLGEGGFGRVYLAHDDDLDRKVAIKVPRQERISCPEDVEAYLAEARMVAKLDHPGIVPVYEVGRTEDGLCFVVSKFVEGCDLAHLMRESRLSHARSAEIVAAVAGALHHAHTRGLVHRDIKPANLLVDATEKVYVSDFGLALRDEDFGQGAGYAGTPSYMSPEQARGEGHRVDGRSDIFSLGVVFYELLSGRRPFIAKVQDKDEARNELLDLIATTEPRPPRQIDDTIPKELERICQRALSKRASERYSTAKDMAEDLLLLLQATGGTVSPLAPAVPIATAAGSTLESAPLPPASRQSDSARRPIKIIPKGLRSFDEHDAEFFLELVPGPRDREGLPESLRFWKTRIEALDPDKTFKVGLIYGPSGCGKSSMMKAGLIPRLEKHVHSVYIEATPEETESRLLRGLRKVCPELPPSLGLVDSIASMRRGRGLGHGRKVLLVLDQFEQWLFARRGEPDTELVAALRQCDGEHVQAIVMIRDDFWLAASRFMRDLEIRLLEGENSALVDLFDTRHATKVLTAFGRAYGALPENPSELTSVQRTFIDQSITGLAQDNKVISVRLALFAEMVKGRPWTPATLKEVGGTQGVGVTFLEETFSATTAPPEHRFHQKAAQAVLKALLPETGTDIKGEMKAEAELRDASGYAQRSRDFDDLIRILDAELRLITPTDPEGSADDSQANRPAGGRYYQFTHDYLISSVREWVTRKQRETRRGRAELKLAERSATWNARPENRQLPSVVEWATIRLLTKRKGWTEPQRKMMRRAGRVHIMRSLGLAVLIGLVTWGGIEGYGNLRAAALVESLKTASMTEVPPIIEQLTAYRRWAARPLDRLLASSEIQSGPHHRASLASLALWPGDSKQTRHLEERLLASSPLELPVIWGILRKHEPGIVNRLLKRLEDPKADPESRFRAACALANSEDAQVKKQWDAVAPMITDRFLTTVIRSPGDYSPLVETLRPIRHRLVPPLAMIFRDKGRSESERSFATTLLADYAGDDPDVLGNLLMDADPKAYATLFPVAERQSLKTIPVFQAEIQEKPNPHASEKSPEEVKDRLAERQARAAVALVRMGKADQVWPLLKHSADPRLRSFLVNWLSPLGTDPKVIASELERIDAQIKPKPADGQQAMEAVLFHPETSIRRALILALGTFGTEGLSPGEREPLTVKLLDLYRNDPDSGIHGASEWTLRRWGQQERLTAADAELMTLKDIGDRRWYVTGQGQTFAVIEGPVEFLMGSPKTEPDRDPIETFYKVRIARRFGIASKEVSVEQYRRFLRTRLSFIGEDPDLNEIKRYSPDPSGPMIGVSWRRAAAYCNWLSEQEGLPEDQWCYESIAPYQRFDGKMLSSVPLDVFRRAGYRLPTEAEWEYACRSGTITRRYYGHSTDLLRMYARYQANGRDQAWPCGSLMPNDLGLFDMLGNVYEWCQNQKNLYPNPLDMPGESPKEEYNLRAHRGGSFFNRSESVRSAFRNWSTPLNAEGNCGFRICRTYR